MAPARPTARLAACIALGLACTTLALAPLPARAVPRHYLLKPEASRVGFSVDFGPDRITGEMPVAGAQVELDFERLANCHVAVTLDAARAEASFPFAAQAMKGPLVLDTAQFPEIRFVSTAVRPVGDGAEIDGDLTIRGVTRPVVLAAELYRQKGTQPGELDHLQIHLTGAVARSAFGAGGWADAVGDTVRLDILADIDRAG